MRLTCNRFLASSTLLSIISAETVYTVWVLIFGNESLSRQLGFTPSTHKALLVPRLVMVGHSSRSYNLMYWQTRTEQRNKGVNHEGSSNPSEVLPLAFSLPICTREESVVTSTFFHLDYPFNYLELSSACCWFVILNFLSQ